jgi:NADH dehydrogenase
VETEVVIVGGGFAGLAAAKELADEPQIHITLIDRKDHHVFQPFLYQVATAGFSASDITRSIRGIFADTQNLEVVQDNVEEVDLGRKQVRTSHHSYKFDYVILACGSTHAYAGKEEWSFHAPGLKTIEDATRIRQRILQAFERAKNEKDPVEQETHLQFVLVGGGSTGVELASHLAEFQRQGFPRDDWHDDFPAAKVILLESGPRLLAELDPALSLEAQKKLEDLGVQIFLQSPVIEITAEGVQCRDRFIRCHNVFWTAGTRAEELRILPKPQRDERGRLLVSEDLSLPDFPRAFVCGDMAHVPLDETQTLPGLAKVALQEGRHAAQMIEKDLADEDRFSFEYRDKGVFTTLGNRKAVMQRNQWLMRGFSAWMAWLAIDIYHLIAFKHRLRTFSNWLWRSWSLKRDARPKEGPENSQHDHPLWTDRPLHT